MGDYGNIAEDQTKLIQGLINREENALRVLYTNYGGALNGVILRIVSDSNIAEEVLQDVMVKIWHKIEQYDAKRGRLFTWMMQLARNTALDKLKSREVSQRQKTDQLDYLVSKIESANPVMNHIPDIGILKLLKGLRSEERVIVDLVYFKGYTQSEIAKHIGVPLGTVKTRLRMALKNLRKALT